MPVAFRSPEHVEDPGRNPAGDPGPHSGTADALSAGATGAAQVAAGERHRAKHVEVIVAGEHVFAAGEQTPGVKHLGLTRFDVHDVARVEGHIGRVDVGDFAWLDPKRDIHDRGIVRKFRRTGTRVQHHRLAMLLPRPDKVRPLPLVGVACPQHLDLVLRVESGEPAGFDQRVQDVVLVSRELHHRPGRAPVVDADRPPAGSADAPRVFADDDHVVGPLSDHRDDRTCLILAKDPLRDVRLADRVADLVEREPFDLHRFEQRQRKRAVVLDRDRVTDRRRECAIGVGEVDRRRLGRLVRRLERQHPFDEHAQDVPGTDLVLAGRLDRQHRDVDRNQVVFRFREELRWEPVCRDPVDRLGQRRAPARERRRQPQRRRDDAARRSQRSPPG